MRITRTLAEVDYVPQLKSGSVHVVAFAEEGFSFFKAYAEFALGFSIDEGVAFCDRINHADETGTLWPRGNLTALLKRHFREHRFDKDGFRRCVREAFIANRNYCKSSHMVFHLFCADMNLDAMYQEICGIAQADFAKSGIDQVTIHMNEDKHEG